MFESIENTISILSFLNGLKEKLFREIGPLKKSLHDDIEQYFLDCFLKLREFQSMNIEKIDQDTKKWVELLAHEEQFFLEKSDLSIKDMYDFSSKTTVLSTGFENFLKQNKKEAELVKQLKTKLKAFSEVLHSQIKNYVDEEKVVNISSLEKEKNVLMVFIKQHFQEFKVLYVFFILSMLWLDWDRNDIEELLKNKYMQEKMEDIDLSPYLYLLDELFTKIISRIDY